MCNINLRINGWDRLLDLKLTWRHRIYEETDIPYIKHSYLYSWVFAPLLHCLTFLPVWCLRVCDFSVRVIKLCRIYRIFNSFKYLLVKLCIFYFVWHHSVLTDVFIHWYSCFEVMILLWSILKCIFNLFCIIRCWNWYVTRGLGWGGGGVGGGLRLQSELMLELKLMLLMLQWEGSNAATFECQTSVPAQLCSALKYSDGVGHRCLRASLSQNVCLRFQMWNAHALRVGLLYLIDFIHAAAFRHKDNAVFWVLLMYFFLLDTYYLLKIGIYIVLSVVFFDVL